MIHKFHWFDLTARDFAALDPTRTVAVLPIAATEQHGPHLSVGTDAIIAQGLCDTVIRTLGAHHSHSAALSALFLPVQSIGKSNEHIRSPGTLTLSYTTIIRMMVEIGESIARAGVRKLVENPGRDRQAMNQLEGSIAAFEAAGGRIPIDTEAPERLIRVRWMLEELRVGLFAQELRTAETVSPQRIAKALAD